MEIRKIKPSERIHYRALSSLCFLDGRRWDVREALRNPPEEEQPDHGGRTGSPTWGAFDDGKLNSATVVNDYTIRMNGHDVKMGGIGGVATRPEYRGKGYTREIMRAICNEMREVGQIYSFLYPFSYEFYRKFGYELCFNRRMATIPIDQFAKFPYPAKFVAHEPEDDTAPFARLYDNFIADRNLAVVRGEGSWKWTLNRDPYLRMQFTYLNYGSDGVPNAYLLYNTEKRDGSSYIQIRELCWSTPEGLFNVFGFFGRMGAEYKGVRWNIPDGLNIQAILPDGYAVEWGNRATGMNRVVDVPAVLNLHPAPAGKGKVTIGITDDFMPVNTGLYTLEWEDGKLTAKQSAESFTNADAEMNVTTLAQLVTGYIDPVEAQYRRDAVMGGKFEEMVALFPKKRLYLIEGF
jgi:predicted acetyltransferase